MPLTDAKIRAAKPKVDKPYKIYDESGLFLRVSANASKHWRWRFRFEGVEKTLSFGAYPSVSLAQARQKRDDGLQTLSEGRDPSKEAERKAREIRRAAVSTFEAVAQELIELHEADGMAEVTLVKHRWLLSLLTPAIGDRPVNDIEPLEVLAPLKKLEKAGLNEAVHRARSFAARVFKLAIVTGRAKYNPAADLGIALVSRKTRHFPALIAPDAVGGLMRAIADFDGYIMTRFALRFIAHTFVRPGECRRAEWSEFDFQNAIWRIPSEKMKMRREHVAPLSRQMIDLLMEVRRFSGNRQYVFPSVCTWERPLSENTLNAALRRLGYTKDEMVSHGFRTTASTLLNESGIWTPDAIERALSHQEANSVRRIYNRAAHWDERVEMAQWWSDYLDDLQASALPLEKRNQPRPMIAVGEPPGRAFGRFSRPPSSPSPSSSSRRFA